MRQPTVAGQKQADAACANFPPICNYDMQFQAWPAETVLNFTSSYCETGNLMNDRLTTWHFDCHGGGVYVYGFSVNHSGAVVPTFDRKTVPIPKFVYVLGDVPKVKYFGV